jgi:DNA helicase HerA-like ATPase
MKPKNTTPPFQVAEGWPRAGASANLHETAVQTLVANHTLIVGQSRSGKTTAARRLIEEVLAWTEAKVVILDPNADFKFLSELRRNQSDKEFVKRWKVIGPKIEIAAPDGTAWGIRWNKLSFEEMAAFLRLTPKETFAEYRHLDRHYKYEKNKLGTLEKFANGPYFSVAVGEDLERYRLLLQELATRKVWATRDTDKDLDTLLAEDPRAVVVDLSTDDEQVRTITAARALEVLWRQAENRRKTFLRKRGPWSGTLVVIDEAHVFAPPSTEDPQKRAVCERIARFADQGKKLNLYLMVITQQPSKLHKGVLSECNNRIILRMNERLSLQALEETYGGIRGRYDGALTFKPGEALVEGALLCDEVPPPTLPRGAKFIPARTKEGGGTPKGDWARPKFT